LNETIDSFYRAMQQGPDGIESLVALLARDAVWVEPFTGGTHEGHDAIRTFLKGSTGQLPDVRITVERIEVSGDALTTSWVCESTAFAKPSRGRDRFTIRDGEITRLETTLLEPPELRVPRD
jgi:ketosteroid isomerase-like protein